jgi:hypothetical protein
LNGCVLPKRAASTYEPLPDKTPFGSPLRSIVAKLRNAVGIEIPTAYEDETGFHKVAKAAEKEIEWPSV